VKSLLYGSSEGEYFPLIKLFFQQTGIIVTFNSTPSLSRITHISIPLVFDGNGSD